MPVSFVEEILQQLDPMFYAEGTTNNSLSNYLSALGSVFQLIEEYASDDPDTGAIGWSLVVDIDRCPDEALPYLAQFVGVKLTDGLAPADMRQQIRDLGNMNRGTVAAMKGAPAPYLTGSKTVIFRERFDPSAPGADSPGHIQVITYDDQTPDPVIVQAALYEQKPAGLILHYLVNFGQDYLQVRTTYATYTALRAAYATYEGMRADEPGV